MIEASIETANDPSSPAMKHAIEDAMNAGRREAIRSAFEDLREVGEEPLHHHVRSARAGEEITGQILGHDDRVASLVTDQGIVVADRAGLPEKLPDDEEITFTARSTFPSEARAAGPGGAVGAGASAAATAGP